MFSNKFNSTNANQKAITYNRQAIVEPWAEHMSALMQQTALNAEERLSFYIGEDNTLYASLTKSSEQETLILSGNWGLNDAGENPIGKFPQLTRAVTFGRQGRDYDRNFAIEMADILREEFLQSRPTPTRIDSRLAGQKMPAKDAKFTMLRQ